MCGGGVGGGGVGGGGGGGGVRVVVSVVAVVTTVFIFSFGRTCNFITHMLLETASEFSIVTSP